jgi:hypothetical protein
MKSFSGDLVCPVLLLAVTGLLIAGRPARAQFNPVLEGGARRVGLCGATTALRGDVWGYGNPASWSTLERPAASLMASQAYGLAAMRLGAATFAYPTSIGTAAATARAFGFEDYRETRLEVGFARGVTLGTSRRFHVAATARYYHLAIDGYGSAGAVGLSVGWLVEVLPGLDLGGHATNLNQPALAGREDLPRTLSAGLAFAPSDALVVTADVFKDVRFPATVRAGVEVRPLQAFSVRAGAAAQPARYALGAGLHLSWLRAHLAADRHPVLGWSPALSTTVQF